MTKKIPVPPELPPDIQLTWIEEFDESEIVGEVSHQLTAHARNRDTASMLIARGHKGTVDRYKQSQKVTIENIEELRNQEHLSTLVAHNSGGRVLGLATIQENLPLREQHRAIPAALARRIGGDVSPLVESEHLPTFNVFGWVSSGYNAGLGPLAAHRAVYEELHRLAPDSWTIESTATHAYIHSGIIMAGYEPLGVPEMYDELEQPWVPPLSQFYIAQTALENA